MRINREVKIVKNEDDTFTCVMCLMEDKEKSLFDDGGIFRDATIPTLSQLKLHIRLHLRLGHNVPFSADKPEFGLW